MSGTINRLTVFIGSPSDCGQECRIVNDLVPDLNGDLRALGIPLEFNLLHWKNSVFPDVGRPQDMIVDVLDEADVVLLVFWHRFGTNAGRRWTGTEEEFHRALERRHREGRPRLLLYFKECELPYDVDLGQLRRLREFRKASETRPVLLAGTFLTQDEFRTQVRRALLDEARRWTGCTSEGRKGKILAAPETARLWTEKRTRLSDKEGFAPVYEVFCRGGKAGQVFAVELLTEEVQFTCRDRQKTVCINRRTTSDGIYTSPAKRALCDLVFDTPDMGRWAQRVDKEIDDFLRGRHTCDLELPLGRTPLRWGSGGVLPVVSYRGRTWTSFFFRDIWPEGWNIPLGASEATDDLQNPWSWIWREFLEELLVLRQRPTDDVVEWRRPAFADNPGLVMPAKLADDFSEEHIDLRRKCDGIVLRASEDRPLKLDAHPTDTILEIRGPRTESSFSNVFFVAVNPRELGVEIVAPVSYSLDDDDYLLDGEILKPKGGEPELVRMPIALISHDYLRRSFGGIDRPLQFDNENHASVVGDELCADDIVIFDWDIQQRLAIAEGRMPGRGTESERHRRWQALFGAAFEDARQNGRFSKLLRRFTATSAKVAGYYLS